MRFKNYFKVLLLTLILLLSFSINIYASESQNIHVFYNNTEIPMNPTAQIINERTLVPLRAFLEYFGLYVGWVQEAQQVVTYNDKVWITLVLNSNEAIINTTEKKFLDVPAQLIENRVFIPLRFFAEQFNLNVEWDQKTQSVLLTDKDVNNPLLTSLSVNKTL